MQPTEQSDDIITNDIPYIKQVTIKGLFGKKDIDWTLGAVNVLVGQNGSGKSTILRMIRDALLMDLNIQKNTKLMNEIEISLGDDFHTKFSKVPANADNLKAALEGIKSELPGIHSDEFIEYYVSIIRSGEHPEFVDGLPVFTCNFIDEHDESQTNRLLERINVEYLSTFDMMLLTKQEIDEISGDKYTQLDVELDKQMNRLAHYQLVLSRQVSKEYKSAAKQLDFQTIEDRVLHRVNQFEQALNNLFNPNDKQFKINDDGAIEVSYLGDKLPLTALSSGEKQLILILLKVVNSSDKPTILLLDEPEVSLHLTWQENLIKTIRAINDQCQLIIVTHSPALVMNGWMDCYTELKDITTDTQ
jgi:ABC-type cobalamin/Fe3+-siderophores transport system ATPase subunit